MGSKSYFLSFFFRGSQRAETIVFMTKLFVPLIQAKIMETPWIWKYPGVIGAA